MHGWVRSPSRFANINKLEMAPPARENNNYEWSEVEVPSNVLMSYTEWWWLKNILNISRFCDSEHIYWIVKTSKGCVLQINDELCKKLKISWPVISAYNPQTNGLDERFNGTLKSRLSKLCEDQKDDWECFLDDVASSMRTRIHATTKFSPYFLMFGRPARSPYEVRLNFFMFCLFPIWGRYIKFSFTTYSGLVLLLFVLLSPSCIFL